MFVKLLVGLLAVGGVGTAVVIVAAPDTPSAEQAVVTHLVDGDTFDVSVDGRSERIRMLNIDTPEITDPDKDVQCLGPEASEHLASLIPVGTAVMLEYDEERTDGYDRTLAGVFTSDGTLINAEMARAGLARPVVFGGNDRFYPPVLAARDEAVAQRRGLFSPNVACTVPGRLEAVSTAVTQAPTAAAQPANASSTALDTAAVAAARVVAAARALEGAFAEDRSGHVWAVFTQDEQDRLAQQVTGLREKAQREVTVLRNAALTAEAAEVAAERAAEDERQAREAEARRWEASQPPKPPARQPAPQPVPRSDPAPDPGSSANPYPGYTGPRCYAPGGKTWKPC